MSKPLVSVIIPAYNCQEYIHEAIDTILNQTYKAIEIIVVDSSTDDTRQLLKRYGRQVRYFYQEPRGVSAARNFGLKQAYGTLVAFQDADDRWFPGKLEVQVRALEKFPDAKLVFSDYAMFDHSGVILPSACFPHFKLWFDRHKIPGAPLAIGRLYWELMLSNCIGTCSVLVEKAAIDEFKGFDESFRTCEDLDLWLRLTTKYSMLYVDEVLAEYRVRDTGLSGSQSTRRMTWDVDRIRVREKHVRNCLVPDQLRAQVKHLQGKHCWEVGCASLTSGDNKNARAMFLTGIPYRPLDWRMWLYLGMTFLPTSIIFSGIRIKQALRSSLARHALWWGGKEA